MVWIGGALVSELVTRTERRADCVDREGWFKGLFWCSEDPSTPISQANDDVGLFFKSLLWPVKLISGDGSSDEQPSADYTPHELIGMFCSVSLFKVDIPADSKKRFCECVGYEVSPQLSDVQIELLHDTVVLLSDEKSNRNAEANSILNALPKSGIPELVKRGQSSCSHAL